MKRFKLVTFIPKDSLNKVQRALCGAGAGRIGKYDYCTFISEGRGSFRPLKGADPLVGEEGKIAEVDEYRLETLVEEDILAEVIKALKESHPYETPAYDLYLLYE